MLIEENLYLYNCIPRNKFFQVMWLFIFLMQLIGLAIIDETAFCLPLVSFQKTLIICIFLNFVQHNVWVTFLESHSHFLQLPKYLHTWFFDKCFFFHFHYHFYFHIISIWMFDISWKFRKEFYFRKSFIFCTAKLLWIPDFNDWSRRRSTF